MAPHVPTLTASAGALLVVCLVVAGLPAPSGSAAEAEEGHWENMGEDGWIWVPAEPPLVTNLPGKDLGAYHNYTEMVALLDSLAAARPGLFTLTSAGTSVEGRTLWLMRVTGPGVDSERPRIFFDGAHHGNEVIGSETLIRFLVRIHEGYDTDPTMQAILDEVVIDVLPMVNVDSVARIPQCSHYAMCRKNSNGVDLNRNYPDHWGGSGSSSDPGSATYRGPFPLSEPESQAVAALLDQNDYALHASFHSGIELILWPHGWTTMPPLEEALYQELGDELTALTGVPHGQTSKVLYVASGTTMDQAYGSAAGWRPISFSPEAYVGSGNAFAWWSLFNPAETEAAITPVVERWMPFLWHLAAEAPNFRPVMLDVPDLLGIGPNLGALVASIEPPSRRPLIGASLHLHTHDAPVSVESMNPFPLPDGSSTKTASFSLLAERGGSYQTEVVLDAGPAGSLTREVTLVLAQVGLEVVLEKDTMGTPHENVATVSVAVGPFEAVTGTVSLRAEPSGRVLGSAPFEALPGDPAASVFMFDAAGLAHGTHRIVATASFDALWEGDLRPGLARVETPLVVERPQISLQKHFPVESPLGEPLSVLSIYRNTGNLVAGDIVVSERIPPGYTYWFRDGPVPLPQDPLGSPMPDSAEVAPDGSLWLTWSFRDLAPGGSSALRYSMLPVVPGESDLSASWSYTGDFGGEVVVFEDEAGPVHRTV